MLNEWEEAQLRKHFLNRPPGNPVIIPREPPPRIMKLIRDGYLRVTKVYDGVFRQETGEEAVVLSDGGQQVLELLDENRRLKGELRRLKSVYDEMPEVYCQGL